MLDIESYANKRGYKIKSKPQQIESEVKCLIRKPNLYKLANTPGIRNEWITQTYLHTDDAHEEVRLREIRDSFEQRAWWITRKIKAAGMKSGEIQRLEQEWQIPYELYKELYTLYADKTIRKRRIKVDYILGNCLEIDIYKFWETQALLEIENLTLENGQLLLPAYIHIIKDVTHNPHYTNSYLARRYGSSEKL